MLIVDVERRVCVCVCVCVGKFQSSHLEYSAIRVLPALTLLGILALAVKAFSFSVSVSVSVSVTIASSRSLIQRQVTQFTYSRFAKTSLLHLLTSSLLGQYILLGEQSTRSPLISSHLVSLPNPHYSHLNHPRNQKLLPASNLNTTHHTTTVKELI